MIEALRKISAQKAWQKRQSERVLRPSAEMKLYRASRWLALTDTRDPKSLALAQAMRQSPRLSQAHIDVLRLDMDLQPGSEVVDPLIWHRKSLGFNRLPTREVLMQWQDKHYDVCINLLSTDSPAFDFLCRGLSAHIKVALNEQPKPSYDLTLKAPDQTSPKDYLEHLFHYLDVLSPNHA